MVRLKNQLAIIDWGIGGMSIYKLIKSELGNLPVIYFFRYWCHSVRKDVAPKS